MQKISHITYSYADPNGEFTEGNITKGAAPTILRAAWLNTVQRELVAIVENLGGVLRPDQDDQLYQAISPITPLRSEPLLPTGWSHSGPTVFPEILSSDGKLSIINQGNGTITIPAGQSFIWRGVWEIRTEDYSTTQRTFAVSANKTYHLRWRPGSGFSVYDLGNHTYNPGGVLSEADIYFDTQIDDMLIALVQTNANNIPTIITLANKRQLMRTWESIQNMQVKTIKEVENSYIVMVYMF